MKKNLLYILIAAIPAFLFSCSKEDFITSPLAQVAFTDSIKFDTVFTTAGSTTRSFKIFNNNDQKISFSNIQLAGGNTSPFALNINGIATNQRTNVEVAANDSIYIFVTVRIAPGTGDLPFIIKDSILITYNGTSRYVLLEAYGQNANFLRNVVLSGNQTWSSKLPYVILGSLTLDASATLTIAGGTNIYLHADAPLLVDGTLILNGTLNNKIIFRGDRLDEPYKNFPAGWPGIYLRASSKNNIFTFAEIRNATQAVSVSGPSVNGNPKLVMQKVIIDNAFEVGLVCSNATVAVSNSLISNCKNNIVLQGGNYTLTHCTLAGYSTKFIQHAKPVLTVADFNLINGNPVYAALQANFINCIFWGENNAVPQEVQVVRQGNLPFALSFDRCLYKADIDPPNSTLISVIKNQDPLFDTIDYNNNFYDFRITKNSSAPGINKGVLTTFTKDLDDKNRNVGLPDLGAYEKQ